MLTLNEKQDLASLFEITTDDVQINEALNEVKRTLGVLQEDTMLSEDVVFKKSKTLLECEAIINKMQKHGMTKGKNEEFKKLGNELSTKLSNHFNFTSLTLDFDTAGVVTSASMQVAEQVLHKMARGQFAFDLNGFLNRLMMDIFNGMLMPSAHTFKNDVSFLPRIISPLNSLITEKTNDGLKFKGIGPAGYIHMGDRIVFDELNTGGEVLSIILHEIGHNFYVASGVGRGIAMLAMFQNSIVKLILVAMSKLMDILSMVIDKTELGKVINSIGAAIRDMLAMGKNFKTPFDPFLVYMSITKIIQVTAGYKQIAAKYKAAIDSVIKVLASIINGTFKAAQLANPLQFFAQFLMMDVRGEERFCDDFAAIHGYGPELSKALTKMQFMYSQGSFEASKKDIAESMYAINLAMISDRIMDIAMVFDPHPATEARAVHMIETLKQFEKAAKSKSEKEHIRKQIDGIAKYSAKAYFSKSREHLDEVKEGDALKYLITNGYLGGTVAELVDRVWNSVGLFNSQGAGGNTFNFVKSADDNMKG